MRFSLNSRDLLADINTEFSFATGLGLNHYHTLCEARDSVLAFLSAPLPSCVICDKPFSRSEDSPLAHGSHFAQVVR